MLYEFSVQSFFVGVLIIIAGAIGVVYHQKLADNLADGLNSYDKFKFWGLVVCGHWLRSHVKPAYHSAKLDCSVCV